MTVFVVLDEHWDSTQILGIYGSAEAAMQAHPAPRDCEWKRNAEVGAWWIDGLKYGTSVSIRPHTVQALA